MSEDIKDELVKWLKTKTVEEIVYVKKNPEISIFLKHPELTQYEIDLLVLEPDRIQAVKRALSHSDRLLALRSFSKNLNLQYIILNPFDPFIEPVFKNKVAVVTAYPTHK